MKACGIIAEYNPFHNGHLYHAQEARKRSGAACVAAIMSGNFTQRGEPAIIDKFSRASAALSGGIDLVLELPYVYAVQHSDLFAHGAIDSLNRLGVDSIVFGSEDGSTEHFHEAIRTLNQHKTSFDRLLKQHLADGLSFPEASRHVYQHIGLDDILTLSSPNNILGFAYIRAIERLGSAIQPLAIQRIKNNYHDAVITSAIASATSVRGAWKDADYDNLQQAVPASTYEQLHQYKKDNSKTHNWEIYYPFIRYKLLTASAEALQAIHGMDEGLEYRFKRYAQESESMEELFAKVKTKRYTRTRLQRTMTHLLTDTKKAELSGLYQQPVPYLRILGMNKTGQQFIHERKKQMQIPMYTQLKTGTHPLADIELRAAEAYLAPLPPKSAQRLKKQEIIPTLLPK